MDAFSMGLVAAMGALATVAGASEDIESDIGSQSNPNSQVQLAAQVGNPHRIYNKAISGEPPANALWCATAAMVAYTLIKPSRCPHFCISSRRIHCRSVQRCIFHERLLWQECQPGEVQPVGLPGYRQVHHAIDHGACLDNIVLYCNYFLYHGLYAANAHHPFPIPIIALVWGLAVGAIGSSVGDIHYGGEREFQNRQFGCGLNTMLSGQYCEEGRGGSAKLH